MTLGGKGPPRTPTMIRTGYDRAPLVPRRDGDPRARMPLVESAGGHDMFDDWLSHLAAGRISVR